MFLYLWWSKIWARRECPEYGEIAADPERLVEAMNDSRSNGSSERLRAALANSAVQFGASESLMNARRDVLQFDPSVRVRKAALTGIFWSASYALADKIYPYGARQALQAGLSDKDPDIRKAARKFLHEFDRGVEKKGLRTEHPFSI